MDSQELINKIGQRITFLRKKRGWTSNELGLEADIDKSALINIEKGRKNITAKTLYKIAKALNVSLRDLMPKDKIE